MYVNFYGTYTLYKKEVWRFLKVYNQTLFAPVINSLLFLAIFMLAIGSKVLTVGNVGFASFMSAGLLAMVMVQNAFANSSSSFTMGKVLGHITDLLIPPLSPFEISTAIVLAALTRGVIVGLITVLTISFFVELQVYNFWILLYFSVAASFLLGCLGLLCGIYANSFDQMSAVTSYIITPLSFLSGTFYSVQNLPDFWYKVSQYNPFFYMIDGVRYGMTGYHDGNLLFGGVYVAICGVATFLISVYILHKGYRIKN